MQQIPLASPYAKMGYYEDALVVAYPALKGENLPMQLTLKNTYVHGKPINKAKIMDFNYDRGVEIKKDSSLLHAQQYPKVILPEDYPDPTIVRDGKDYYMKHSS